MTKDTTKFRRKQEIKSFFLTGLDKLVTARFLMNITGRWFASETQLNMR